VRFLFSPWVVAPVLIGLMIGGSAGALRFARIDSHDSLCVSCHHGTSDPAALDDPPHSTSFAASCHVCHVLPVKEYLSFAAVRLGGDVPAWIEGLDNPVIAEQSCLECHLSHGRGSTDCAHCHIDGSKDIDITERCEACHHDQGMTAAFEGLHCRNCHVEAFHDQRARARTAMIDRMQGHSSGEKTGGGSP
jgi:hypothetical protein